jgi:hypothetical protein
MGRKLIVVIAGCAAVVATPSAALAQGAFTDYRQAAADQYPTQPPPGDTGSGSNQQGGDQQTGGAGGAPTPAGGVQNSHGNSGSGNNGSGVGPDRSSGGTPVAVPTGAVSPEKGSLPFTGSNLSGLVVLALALIAAGFLLAAVERATRRRRAPA